MESADLAGRIDTVEQRMDSMELHWDASFAALSRQILQSNCETREAILATLRGEVAGEFATTRAEVAGEFATMRAEVAGEFATMRAEVAGEFAMQRAHFETALADGQDETRRYMKVLYEDILSRIALLGEARPFSS
jgi:prolyl-tRNA synthetase